MSVTDGRSDESVAAASTRSMRWLWLSALVLCLPVVVFGVALLWWRVYGALYAPPLSDSNYTRAPGTFLFVGVPLFGLCTLILGVLLLRLARGGARYVALRRWLLGGAAGLSVLVLVGIASTSFSLWGGRTPFNKPDYGNSSAEAKATVEQAFAAVVKAGGAQCPGAEPQAEQRTEQNSWCTRWEYAISPDRPDWLLTKFDAKTVVASVSDSLETLGWQLTQDPDDPTAVEAYLGAPDTGALVVMYPTSERVNDSDRYFLSLRSSCFLAD